MRYISTRGEAKELGFVDVVLTGVATDGGLYVPKTLPKFTKEQFKKWQNLSYADLAFEVIHPFIGDEIPAEDLKLIIKDTYKFDADLAFSNKKIAPVRKYKDNNYILELFHGPTLAFKDYALQFLGNLLDYILKKQNKHVTIIGATSGDTGSAAIEAVRHSKLVDIFILHPVDRISEVQRKQMTTIIEDNVHNLAIKSDFDFCQYIVKALFNDQEFKTKNTHLVAVNSINWCRILAQMVYYFYSYFEILKHDNLDLDCGKELIYAVPTGNFGDIYAGYLAKKMGLPIKKLIVATNKNDILHRFIANNDYSKGELIPTLSPSMDIQASSNLERLLFDIHDHDGKKVAKLMADFEEKILQVDPDKLAQIREIFSSCAVDDELICSTIYEVYQKYNLTVDPHTATAIYAIEKYKNISSNDILISISTAHPAKFSEAVKIANVEPLGLPNHIKDLFERPEKYTVLAQDADIIKKYILEHSK